MISSSEPATDDRLARLYQDEHHAMLALAYLLVGVRDVAEDLAQDAFAAIGPRLDTIDNPGGYLRTMVVNGSRRWHRRLRQEDRWRIEETAASGTDGSADAVTVRRVLAELPDDQREAVVLRFFGDLSFREIGEVTGCPTQTAATRVRRGLERVRTKLEER